MIERYDNSLLEEAYERVLLLETPATEANIVKYVIRYFQKEIKEYIDDEFNRVYRVANLLQNYYNFYKIEKTGIPIQEFKKKTPRATEHFKKIFKSDAIENLCTLPENRDQIVHILQSWTPKVQQILKNLNMNVDIFGYGSRQDVEAALELAANHITKTATKKAYKRATDVNIVYEDDKLIVVKPRSWEESRKYFGYKRRSILDGTEKYGAKWCTSAGAPDGPKMFKQYTQKNQDLLYYIINKVPGSEGVLETAAPVDSLWAIRKHKIDMSKARLTKLIDLFSKFIKTYITHEVKSGESSLEDATDDVLTYAYDGLFVDNMKEQGIKHPATKYYSQLFHHMSYEIIEIRDQSNDQNFGEYYLFNLANAFYNSPPSGEQDIDKMINFLSCILFDSAPAAAQPAPTA